jgi:predicted nucleic acid-binding protein
MVRYIIDTYAWIEYFRGSGKGDVLRKLFSNPSNKFVTMECCIAELKGACLKDKSNFDYIFRVVKENSFVFPVLLEHWLAAAEMKSDMRKKFKDFGLIDALLMAKQKELSCHIITGDKHFKELKNVVYLS